MAGDCLPQGQTGSDMHGFGRYFMVPVESPESSGEITDHRNPKTEKKARMQLATSCMDPSENTCFKSFPFISMLL